MSERKVDKCNRYRSNTVSFRLSPEETKELNVKVALSGMCKKDYIVDCLLKHEIRVVCGIKVARTVQTYLEAILKELQFCEEGAVPNEEIFISNFICDGNWSWLYGMRSVEATEKQTTEDVMEDISVAYDPSYVVALAIEKIKAYGKILVWENLDRLPAEGDNLSAF